MAIWSMFSKDSSTSLKKDHDEAHPLRTMSSEGALGSGSHSEYVSSPELEPDVGLWSPKKTPLPKLQIAILLYLQLAEPITSTVIYPFVNQLIREIGVTGGDEHKTGYFAGLIESSFYAMDALCVMQWGRASDRFGRKPILLTGLFGLTISMLGFGLSRMYWTLLLSRCAAGALNGNIGVTKSMMAELTDESNRTEGFAYMPLIWVLGATIGPMLGGILARPADHWPNSFKSEFWNRYRYFLPCVTAAAYSVTAFMFALIGLKETLPASLRKAKSSSAGGYTAVGTVEERPLLDDSGQAWGDAPEESQGSTYTDDPPQGARKRSDPKSARVEEFEVVDSPVDDVEDVPPAYTTIRSILIPQVLYPILNYAFLALVDESVVLLVPLMYSTPVDSGGLGFDPITIGAIQGAAGIIGGAVQIYTFPWLHERLGTKQLYVFGYASFLPCLCAFPVLHHVTQVAGQVTALTWIAVVVQHIAYAGTFMTFGCLFMYISAAAPHQSALGLTNGLAQTTASIVRTFAPSTAASLFALSQQYNLLNGTLVYWILCLVTVGGLIASTYLPATLRS